MTACKPRWALTGALLLTGCGGGSSGADSPPDIEPKLGAAQNGEATFYSATGAGNCLYDPAPDDLMVAAINAPQYFNSQSCGLCAEVSGPKGAITVRIVDQCPECKTGDLDLSEQAFTLIADKSAGRVPITWLPVPCPVQGPVALRFKEGSSQWWLALQVRNSRLPIRQIEMQTPAGFVGMERQDYNYATNPDHPGQGPYTFRITAVDGQQLTETGVLFQEGGTVEGTQQFQ